MGRKRNISQNLFFMHFWQTHQARCWFCLHFGSLVGGNNLIDPIAQVGDTGVHSRGPHIAIRGAPGDNTDKIPHTTALTDQRAPGVTLKCQNMIGLRRHTILYPKVTLVYCWSTIIKLKLIPSVNVVVTWQEDTPDAPAQIMASLILLEPQYCLHWVGLSRGRAVCWR